MNRIQAKIITEEPLELMKFLCLVTMIKSIGLKMDIVLYHIFMNLVVNHTVILSSNINHLFCFLV